MPSFPASAEVWAWGEKKASRLAVLGKRTFWNPLLCAKEQMETETFRLWPQRAVGVSVLGWVWPECGWLPSRDAVGILALFPMEQNYCPNLPVSQVEMLFPERAPLRRVFLLSFRFAAYGLELQGNCQGWCFLKTRLGLLNLSPGSAGPQSARAVR